MVSLPTIRRSAALLSISSRSNTEGRAVTGGAALPHPFYQVRFQLKARVRPRPA